MDHIDVSQAIFMDYEEVWEKLLGDTKEAHDWAINFQGIQ